MQFSVSFQVKTIPCIKRVKWYIFFSTAKHSSEEDAPVLHNSTISYKSNARFFFIMANHTPKHHTIKIKHDNWPGCFCRSQPDRGYWGLSNRGNWSACRTWILIVHLIWLVLISTNHCLEPDEDKLAAMSEIPQHISSSLQNLIGEHHDMFAKDETEIGLTHLIEMDIDTKDHPPISLTPYRTSLAHCKLLEQENR